MNENSIISTNEELNDTVQALAAEFQRTRNEQAFEELYKKTRPFAYKQAATYLNRVGIQPDETTINDIIQISYSAVFLSVDRYDTSRSFLTWFKAIILHRVQHHKRKEYAQRRNSTEWALGEKGRTSVESLVQEIDLRNTTNLTPEQATMAREELSAIMKQLRHITDNDDQIIAYLMRINGESTADVVQVTGYTNRNAVSNAVRKIDTVMGPWLRKHFPEKFID